MASLSSVVRICVAAAVALETLTATAQIAAATQPALRPTHQFNRVSLTADYFSEGVNLGDIDGDGITDVVHGPYWFPGPDFDTPRELYEPVKQPRQAYADSFFSWVYDFDRDGLNDVLAVGFPGTPAYIYQNPGSPRTSSRWSKHQIFDWVSNESPQFLDLTGDEVPELVCTRDGFFGYASFRPDDPYAAWQFHPISSQVAPKRFGHGLGLGDINGDGRADLLMKDGWFEHPATLLSDPEWKLHRVPFAPAGGAEMYAYDVDGDGDNDVITSLSAHAFGLAWYEQLRDGERIHFRPHKIMGEKPAENRYGVVFSELHSLNLADIDGDGLKDIVTGKTYWSHHQKSPGWDAGAVVYWFKLVRGEAGIDWIPHLADTESGIGRQLVVGDIDGDELPDIVVGGMKGCHLLRHETQLVDDAAGFAGEPFPRPAIADGLTPQEAANRMTVPAGFDVQLAAGEPQVHQPIAFALDHRGRVWVAEAHTYPVRAPDGQGRDRIIILEDTNGDGTLDSRRLFIDQLNLVSGLELGFGGVWVGAAPYLLFIPDQDEDDHPDSEPQIVLDGFGYEDTHETLNSFIWGPDGWLYGCHGVFTRSLVGAPGTPAEQRVPLNAGVWRFHPTRQEFEVFAWGTSNPWGVDFNELGEAFCTACVIPHLYHVIQGARYQRQAGQHFNPFVFDDIKTIADHLHYVGSIRDHAWWGHEPVAPTSTLRAGGGHAHCGAMIYLGDQWPREFRDQILFNNVHGNRINADTLVAEGSGYRGKHGSDFLLANDRWYRGINLKYGPDGGVYLIDWYDKNACHRRNPEIWDRTNGRIYKVSYHGEAQAVAAQPSSGNPGLNLRGMLSSELVELQLHPNDWFVRTARRVLQERGADPIVCSQLQQILDDRTRPVAQRLRGLWALHAVGGLTGPVVDACLNDQEEYLRAWAIQLHLELPSQTAGREGFVGKLHELAAADPSAVVRRYVASALQRLPNANRWSVVTALLGHQADSQDHNLPLLYWYGFEPLVAADPVRAIKIAKKGKIPLVYRYALQRAASETKTMPHVVEELGRATGDDARIVILDAMLSGFQGRTKIPLPANWSDVAEHLLVSQNPSIRERAEQVAVAFGDRRIFPRLREILVDAARPLPQRERALQILVQGDDDAAASSLQKVLDEPALREPALKGLAAFDDDQTPAAILQRYASFPDTAKQSAVATLVARPEYALQLLAALGDGQVPRADVHAYHVRQLLRFENPEIARQLREVWGEVRSTNQDKRQQIEQYKSALGSEALAAADRGNGRRIFHRTCASCHKLFADGGTVGPEITGSNRADLDYILSNVVDPSSVLGKDYQMSLFAMDDGRVISGLIQKETPSAVTVRTINDTVVLPKDEIDERRLSAQSLMPEQLLDPLTEKEVADLVAYLGSSTQVPLRGPAAPIEEQSKRVPGALEGEALVIVSKTSGSVNTQPMASFTHDRWSNGSQLFWTGAGPGDRLELEIKVPKTDRYDLEVVLTMARDYGIVQLSLADVKLGSPIDLFNEPDVITTGVLTFAGQQLGQGTQRLAIEITGAHPKAVKSFMVGLDYIRIVPRN